MGASSGDPSQAETSGTATPPKQGLSFSLGKKKGTSVMQFGVKSKPVKSTASAFAESSSEEEEEEEMPEEESRVSFENEQLTSTPTQQQDTLEKVIEYADTLRIKAALRPKLLIRFVKGTEQGGILPGTIPTFEAASAKSETSEVKKRSFKEKKEPRRGTDSEDSDDSGQEVDVEIKKRSFKERKDFRAERAVSGDSGKKVGAEVKKRSFQERKESRRSVEREDSSSSGSEGETKNESTSSDGKQRSFQEKREPRHQKGREYSSSRGRDSPDIRMDSYYKEKSKDCKTGKVPVTEEVVPRGERRIGISISNREITRIRKNPEGKIQGTESMKNMTIQNRKVTNLHIAGNHLARKKTHGKIHSKKRERVCTKGKSLTPS